MSVDREKALRSSTTTAFLTALAVNAGLLLVEVGAFLFLKQRLWRIYSPRTVLPPPDKRAVELPSGPWKWVPALLMMPPEDIIRKNGLDAYMFLRFLRLLMIIFFVFTLSTFAIIIPANAAYIVSLHKGLDRISWINITDPNDQLRFCAHVIVVYLLTAFVLYKIRGEMVHFVHMRHQFLISKSHSRLAQARTVLISPLPADLTNEKDLQTFASFVPGGIDKIWIYRDTTKLNKLFERRQEACEKLEGAESAILKAAALAWRKKEKQFKKINSRKVRDEETSQEGSALIVPPANRELLDDLVAPNRRPKHRTGFLGLFGPKVDTIDWCKEEISRLNEEITEAREYIVKGKCLGSAFVRCNLQLGAHVLAQCLSYHEPLKMYNRWIETHPKDIVWRNLDDGALEMQSRYVISWLATAGLVIVWAFPVGFIGTLSNLLDLCEKVRWLQWVCEAPPVAQGLVEGVLPPALLAALFALLPFILQGLAWYECIPKYSMISVSVYRRFFMFLLIHGFLVVTLSSGITSAIEDIVKNPTQTVQQLSSQLPSASVFFLTYMVTQGLAGAGSALVQLAPLVLHYIRKWFLGRTPRQAYEVTFRMPSADFGVILPRLSLLATIGFAYSVLSPLINLLALISYAMFYIAFKFLLDQVFDQPDEKETGGMYYPMAINNLFVGLYIEQVCLTCLLFLKAKEAGVAAVIQAVFMLVLAILTASAHLFVHNSFSPLVEYLPMSLATKKMAQRYEKQRNPDENGEIDLFSRDRGRSVRKRFKATAKILDGKLDQLKAKVKGGDADSHRRSESRETKRNTFETDLDKSTAETTALDHAHGTVDGPSLSRKASTDSKASKASKKSKASSKKNVPVFDEAAPALDDSDEEEQDEHAFDHPSTYVDQSCVWLPKDPLGLSEFLVNELKAAGIDASDVGASIDEKGVVEVTRNPPDEEWTGGHDQ
ncbi:unnamed protein product [Cyclocybe aegerita]|uniref:DUF221-domain-containing protein n=1 Tax=Cyclocybe aegerita TaxID=1973307 RepID=A0A8S0WJW6_CYCAE|nr:unnamed protein product [Cyclocybe aegerita]